MKNTQTPLTLLELRDGIDEIDQKLQNLITQRAELAMRVANVKKSNDGKDSIFYRPEREAQVLAKVKKRNKSVLSDNSMAMLFREIMSACLAVEQPLKVAYLGPEGTYTQEATYQHFGHAVECLDCASIDQVFHQVEKDNAHYGIVPVENSSNGVIGASLDMLYTQNLKVCGEVEVDIHHQLITSNNKNTINTIYAHQQSLEQCTRWLQNHYPDAKLQAVASNAAAAKMVQGLPNSAAIASDSALAYYSLVKIANNIEDAIGNRTRFLVLSKESVPPSGVDKTSLLVIAKHESGALFDVLEPFKKADINILQLARHPLSQRSWEYLFFIDVVGHQEEEVVRNALNTIASKVQKMVVLGSYPISITT